MIDEIMLPLICGAICIFFAWLDNKIKDGKD
jgi:hypothetical protein